MYVYSLAWTAREHERMEDLEGIVLKTVLFKKSQLPSLLFTTFICFEYELRKNLM